MELGADMQRLASYRLRRRRRRRRRRDALESVLPSQVQLGPDPKKGLAEF